METPPNLPELFNADPAAARQTIHVALAEGRDTLSTEETSTLLQGYGIALTEPGTIASRRRRGADRQRFRAAGAGDPGDRRSDLRTGAAARAGRTMGGPCLMKSSPCYRRLTWRWRGESVPTPGFTNSCKAPTPP